MKNHKKDEVILSKYDYDKDGLCLNMTTTINKKRLEHLTKVESGLRDCLIMLGWTPPTPVELESKVGTWVMTDKHKNLVMLIGEEYNDKAKKWQNKFLDIKGIEYPWSKMITYHPHIFVEKDLELLNTDDVTYRLVDEGERLYIDGHAENGVDKGHIVFTTQTFKTVHEAVESVFTQATAMNLLNSKLGDNNEC